MKKNPDHNYKADTPLSFHLGMGLNGCNSDEETTIGEATSLTDEDLSSMSREEVEKEISETFEFWMANHLDAGWHAEE